MFTICLTHDVDAYYSPFSYEKILSTLIKVKPVSHILQNYPDWKTRFSNPYDTFERILEMETDYHAKSTFFFLNKGKGGSNYNFSDDPIKKIFVMLDKRGWEIALHGSYNSINNPKNLFNDKKELESIIGKKVDGIRLHGLHLRIPQTFEHQRLCGFLYDTSYFGPKYGRKRINKPFYCIDGLLEIPITFMDSDWQFMTDERYNGSIDKTWNRIKQILDYCKTNEFVCTILWHPHTFYNENCALSKKHYSHFKGFAEIYQMILEYGETNNAKMCPCIDVYNDYNMTLERRW